MKYFIWWYWTPHGSCQIKVCIKNITINSSNDPNCIGKIGLYDSNGAQNQNETKWSCTNVADQVSQYDVQFRWSIDYGDGKGFVNTKDITTTLGEITAQTTVVPRKVFSVDLMRDEIFDEEKYINLIRNGTINEDSCIRIRIQVQLPCDDYFQALKVLKVPMKQHLADTKILNKLKSLHLIKEEKEEKTEIGKLNKEEQKYYDTCKLYYKETGLPLVLNNIKEKHDHDSNDEKSTDAQVHMHLGLDIDIKSFNKNKFITDYCKIMNLDKSQIKIKSVRAGYVCAGITV